MTYPEYNAKSEKVIQNMMTNDNGRLMVKVAISAFSFIRERVQETGINANGQKFAPYSTKPMLVGAKSFRAKKYATQMLGSKPKRKELEWRTVGGHKLAILQGGYAELRRLQNMQTDHVDFSVTNEMWNDINVRKDGSGLVSNQSDHMQGVAIIGAKLEKEKKKLAGNTKRKGDILDLNQKEIDDLKLTYNLGVLQIFENNGL
jgi:hypothetical protein